jgi:transposase
MSGEPDHWRILAVPPIQDAERPDRERETLIRETTRLLNRVKACLVRFGVCGFDPTLRTAADRLEKLITPEGFRLPPLTLAEMLRDMARLRFLRMQDHSLALPE